MKRYLAVFAVAAFAAVSSSAQHSVPDDFLGVKFGASPSEARETMTKLEGASATESTAERLSYKGGALAGHPLKAATLDFEAGKFTRGAAALKPATDAVSQFRDVRAKLVAKYGAPTTTSGDGLKAAATWKFPGRLGGPETQIRCEIAPSSPGPTTRIVYWQAVAKNATAGASL